MIKATLKGLALHKTRAVLTTLAVVIGVAMISGAYVLSDTMMSAARSLSSSAYDNTDAVVLKKAAFTNKDNVGTAVTVSPKVLAQVRSLPQVAAATGDVTEQAKLIDKKGKVIGSGPYFAVGLDPVNGKNLTLQFLDRFLLHILPPRFVKIRHFGLMASKNVTTKLELARALLDPKGAPKTEAARTSESWQDFYERLTGKDVRKCPRCGAQMERLGLATPEALEILARSGKGPDP